MGWKPIGAPTGEGPSFASDIVKYTAGNFTLNNTGDMAAVHASGLDLTVPASTGDLIILGISGLVDRQTSNAFTMFDVGTIVSAAIVNRVSGQAAGGSGVLGWFTDSDAPEFAHLSGAFPYAVVAGDIDSGNVLFRLLYRTNAANNVTLRANSTEPLWVWVYKTTASGVIGGGDELTIATGVVTITSGFHTVDTQDDDATDELDTISGGTVGQLLVLTSANDARDPTLADGTGNLILAGGVDFTLSDTDDTITLIYNGTNWLETSRSDNS